MSRQRSLKRELNRWIIVTALIFVLLAGALAGIVSFKQARELQDRTLLEIATLIRAGKVNESRVIHHDIKNDTVIINELGKKQHEPVVPKETPDGMHTMKLNGSTWRVFITTQPTSHRRFSVAQQTKLRDDIAMSSSLSVLLPIILLVGIMIFVIQFIINRQFKSLSQLVNRIDQQDGMNFQTIPKDKIFIEVLPFVESINALLARVARSMRKQQRFIADAAHELRTPVTALSLQVENLKKAQSKTDNNARQEQLQQGLDRLRNLLTQLLDLARLQSDESPPDEVVSLKQVVQDAVENLFPLAEEKSIDLGMLKQEEKIQLKDKQGRLSQLVYNAIDNAIHYTPAGGKVDISFFIENNKAVLLIEDNGIGIPEDELKRVMQPFHRVLQSSEPGNGLGLAISHEIAQQLGGTILLSNRQGGGLCYRYEQSRVG